MTTLLAANDGGHIMQLRSLVDRFGLHDDRYWVTVPTSQTKSLLAGECVQWVDEAPTRDWRAALRNARSICKLFRGHDIARAISTGSSLAISTLPQAALRRIPAHYIESVTRADGFSLSGRMLQNVPGVNLYVQWPHLAGRRWSYHGSVLDGFASAPALPRAVRRVVVSLGTSARFGFRRMLVRLVGEIPAGVDVLWQTGSTVVTGLPIEARPSVPAADLTAAIKAADVVVAHAGAGIALTALQAGKIPVLVPRLESRGEHVDDHQGEIARRLAERGLAIVADADELSWDTINMATRLRVAATETLPTFALIERGR